MSYRVRNEHGELRFETFDDLRDAYLQRLVESDDEVLENGSTTWRKAGSFPTLARALDARPTALQREARWYVLAVVLLASGAYFVIYGWNLVTFAVVAAIVGSFVVWSTFASFRRRRR